MSNSSQQESLFLSSSLIVKSLQWSYCWCMTLCHLKGWINFSNAKSPTKDQSYSTKICWKSGALKFMLIDTFYFILTSFQNYMTFQIWPMYVYSLVLSAVKKSEVWADWYCNCYNLLVRFQLNMGTSEFFYFVWP